MPITTHKPPESVAGWTAAQLIKRDVLSTAVRHGTITLAQAEVTRETVDAVFDPLHEDGTLQDAMEEFRQTGIETGLPGPWSRNYDATQVACELDCGAWVGWTYWHGGGKHGQPSAMPWLDEATLMEVDEEPVQTIKRTFRVAA